MGAKALGVSTFAFENSRRADGIRCANCGHLSLSMYGVNYERAGAVWACSVACVYELGVRDGMKRATHKATSGERQRAKRYYAKHRDQVLAKSKARRAKPRADEAIADTNFYGRRGPG